MAGNYWASTQRRFWLFERDDLDQIRRELEDEQPVESKLQYPVPEMRTFSIFINQQLQRLGRRLHVRQRALATAQVYVRRFYTKVHIRDTNPYLVLATAFYVACKVEECPQHIRYVVAEARSLWPEFFLPFPPDSTSGSTSADLVCRIGECEFWLISELSARLIVHHPYETLFELKSLLDLNDAEMKLATGIVNDSLVTDMGLLYPPHVIGVMAIVMAVLFRPLPRSGMGGFAGRGGMGDQGLPMQMFRREHQSQSPQPPQSQQHSPQQLQQQQIMVPTYIPGRGVVTQARPAVTAHPVHQFHGNVNGYLPGQQHHPQMMVSSLASSRGMGQGIGLGIKQTPQQPGMTTASTGPSLGGKTTANASKLAAVKQQLANTNMSLNMALKRSYAVGPGAMTSATSTPVMRQGMVAQQSQLQLLQQQLQQQKQQQLQLQLQQQQQQLAYAASSSAHHQPPTRVQYPSFSNPQHSQSGLQGASPIAASLLRDGGVNAFSSLISGISSGGGGGGVTTSGSSIPTTTTTTTSAAAAAATTPNLQFLRQYHQQRLYSPAGNPSPIQTTSTTARPANLNPTSSPYPRPSSTSGTTPSTTPATTATTTATRAPTIPVPATMPPRMQKLFNFLVNDTEVNVQSVIECVQELVSLYAVWEGYDEKAVRGMVVRWVRGQELDR